MATKFCPNCGAPVEAGTRFCGSCGKVIEQEPAQQAPAAQQPMIQVNKEAIQQNVQQAGQELQQGLNELRRGIESFQAAGRASGWQGLVISIARFYVSFPLMKSLVHHMFILEGRTNRLRYFTDSLIGCLIGCLYIFLAVVVACLIGGIVNEDLGIVLGFLLGIAVSVPTFVGGILLTRSRLHDMNVTGWAYLANFIPYVNCIFALIVLFAPGTKGPNQYGADPLAGMQ